MTILESLFQQAGFTDYEARAYLALCQQSPQTGYELAKNSRIPRANIYEVLQKLENRGAATRVVASGSVRYLPINPNAVLARMKHDFGEMIADIENHLEDLTNPPKERYVEQFQGYDNLLGFARDQLLGTKFKLLVGIHPAESARLAQELNEVDGRGVAVGVLCLHGCKAPCQACKGEFFKDPLLHRKSPADARSFILISDELCLLAADIQGDKVFGLRTELPLLTKMAGLYMEQSMLLAAVFRQNKDDVELQHRLEEALERYPTLLNRTTALLGQQ